MKIVVAPDKFKGSLTSFDVCRYIAQGIEELEAGIEVLPFPMADGGDGFASVMHHYLHTSTVFCDAVDPLGRPVKASYQWEEKTKTAIIELAVSSGLVLLKEQERTPMKTSTYGTGLVIKKAIERGAQKITLGLGGSATNDAGTGILAALGFTFLNANKETLVPCGGNLSHIHKIIPPSPLPVVQFEIACDVRNVLYGPGGAAYVYAKQKGANKEEIERLDTGLQQAAHVFEQATQKRVADIAGTGAAGGIAAGLMSFFEVQLKSGIELVIEASRIKEAVSEAELVITGEGRLDEQSKEGKVITGIAALAKEAGKRCIGFCGDLSISQDKAKEAGLSAVFSIIPHPMTLSEALLKAGPMLSQTASHVVSFFLDIKNKSVRE